MPEDDKKYTRRRINEVLAAAAAASTLSGDTAQPWAPTAPLTEHDIERLVHWAQGEDANGFPYGAYGGVRTRIFEARAERQSITPILNQLKEAQADIAPPILGEHVLDILTAYDHGERLTAHDREIIRDIMAAWPVEFESHGNTRTRLALVDAIIRSAPVMRDLLIIDSVLTEEELAAWQKA